MNRQEENLLRFAKLIEDNKEVIESGLKNSGYKIDYSNPKLKMALKQYRKFKLFLGYK